MQTWTKNHSRSLLTLALFAVLGFNMSGQLRQFQSSDLASSSSECSKFSSDSKFEQFMGSYLSGISPKQGITSSQNFRPIKCGSSSFKSSRDDDERDRVGEYEGEVSVSSYFIDENVPAATAVEGEQQEQSAQTTVTTKTLKITFSVSSTADLTEASGFCEDGDCENPSDSRSVTETISGIDPNWPQDQIKNYVLQKLRENNTRQAVIDALHDSKDELVNAANSIKRRLEDQENEDKMDEAKDQCKIDEDATLRQFESFMDDGESSDHKVALKGKEKLQCMKNRLSDLSGAKKDEFFNEQLMPTLKEMLMGSEADRNLAQSLIKHLCNGDCSGGSFNSSLKGIDNGQALLGMSMDASSILQDADVYSAQLKANPDNAVAKEQLDRLRQTVETKFGVAARYSVGGAGSEISIAASEWTSELNKKLGVNSVIGDMPASLKYSLENRKKRVLADGSTEVYSSRPDFPTKSEYASALENEVARSAQRLPGQT
ncbi:MAG: hypothetical protein KDD22_00260, partial [Bdellovibrionales bacterium]|nr:hypothetical protein [Bdellovibrionales bacterium]